MHGDNVPVLDAEVVAHNTVDAGATVVQIIIRKDDQNSILALLALHQNCVTPEELKSLHGVIRQGDDRVVIVDGIRHAVDELSASARRISWASSICSYIKELGFFFFLRMAVEVSSSCMVRQYCGCLDAVMDQADLLVLSARGVPKPVVSEMKPKQTTEAEHTGDGPSSSREYDQVRPTW